MTEQEIIELQERVIIRLRAALRTLGKTSAEIQSIADDEDRSGGLPEGMFFVPAGHTIVGA